MGYLSTTSVPTPIGMQGAMPMRIGFRSPRSGTGLGLGRGLPIPDGSGSRLDMPDPELERLVPDWMRRFWAVGTLVPKIMTSDMLGRAGVNGESPGRDASPSSQPQSTRREDRSGGIGWYVGLPNPDERILSRVEGEEVESPPLAPKDPTDIVDEEECAEEWAAARRDCKEGFRGPRGQGPLSIPKGPRGRNYTEDDCARGIVRAICGGDALKQGLSGEQRAKRNNNEIQKRRKDRGK
ncbi:hypothetical protein FHR88_001504 [Bradyrhizobium betae]|nr:hypothetical protein [Bradyrhizobium betae]